MSILPNAVPVSEDPITINGIVATCVEAASGVVDHMYTGVQASSGWIKNTALNWQRNGMAGPGGASNWASASSFLKSEGVPNTAYGPDWFASHNFVPTVDAALGQGKPVLFGLSNAYNLRDSVTGAMPDRGVFGHAITLVGSDAQGYVAVDPNTPATGFEHYTAANLAAAGASSAVIPNNPPLAGPNTPGNSPTPGDYAKWIAGAGVYGLAGSPGVQATGPALNAGGAAVNAGSDVASAIAGAAAGLVGAIKTDLLRIGLFLLVIIFLVFGLYLLFKPQVDGAAQSAGQAAEVAALA